MPPPFEPMFLIAVPQMGDPNFAKSVVLILHHDQEGAMGLVINAATPITLDQFASTQKMECHASLKDKAVFRGGPVQPERGWILHSDESVLEKKPILNGLYVSATGDSLKELLQEGHTDLRLILGYAGWIEGQLEGVMVAGAWITAKADKKYVFEVSPSEVWNRVLTDMGVDPNRLMMGTGLH